MWFLSHSTQVPPLRRRIVGHRRKREKYAHPASEEGNGHPGHHRTHTHGGRLRRRRRRSGGDDGGRCHDLDEPRPDSRRRHPEADGHQGRARPASRSRSSGSTKSTSSSRPRSRPATPLTSPCCPSRASSPPSSSSVAAFPLDDVLDTAALEASMVAWRARCWHGGRPALRPADLDERQVAHLLPEEGVRGGRLRGVPESLDDLTALADQIKADGGTPWCLTMESGDATGWVATDWIEDLVMRYGGVDAYNDWVAGDLPFTDATSSRRPASYFEDVALTEGNVLRRPAGHHRHAVRRGGQADVRREGTVVLAAQAGLVLRRPGLPARGGLSPTSTRSWASWASRPPRPAARTRSSEAVTWRPDERRPRTPRRR